MKVFNLLALIVFLLCPNLLVVPVFGKTITINITAAHPQVGHISGGNASYGLARSQTISASTSTASIIVGQRLSGTYTTYLGYLKFPLDSLPANASIISASISLDSLTAKQTAGGEFAYNVYAAYDSGYSTWLTGDGLNKFAGWSADTSAAWTPDSLAEGLWSGNFSIATYGNVLNFVQAGFDTIVAQNNYDDTLRVALISKNTINGTRPTGYEYITFDSGDDPNPPKLTIEYVELNPVYAATGFNTGAETDTSIKLLNVQLPIAADTTNANLFSILCTDNGYWLQPADSSDMTFNKIEMKHPYSIWKNITIPLVKNYLHHFTIRSWDATGTDSLKTIDVTISLGSPGGANLGRWNPAIDKIQ